MFIIAALCMIALLFCAGAIFKFVATYPIQCLAAAIVVGVAAFIIHVEHMAGFSEDPDHPRWTAASVTPRDEPDTVCFLPEHGTCPATISITERGHVQPEASSRGVRVTATVDITNTSANGYSLANVHMIALAGDDLLRTDDSALSCSQRGGPVAPLTAGPIPLPAGAAVTCTLTVTSYAHGAYDGISVSADLNYLRPGRYFWRNTIEEGRLDVTTRAAA